MRFHAVVRTIVMAGVCGIGAAGSLGAAAQAAPVASNTARLRTLDWTPFAAAIGRVPAERTMNTDLKALVVHGYHDLSTPYFRSRYLLEQSVYGHNARQRLFFGVYPGGHMFYLSAHSRAELFKDVAAFYR